MDIEVLHGLLAFNIGTSCRCDRTFDHLVPESTLIVQRLLHIADGFNPFVTDVILRVPAVGVDGLFRQQNRFVLQLLWGQSFVRQTVALRLISIQNCFRPFPFVGNRVRTIFDFRVKDIFVLPAGSILFRKSHLFGTGCGGNSLHRVVHERCQLVFCFTEHDFACLRMHIFELHRIMFDAVHVDFFVVADFFVKMAFGGSGFLEASAAHIFACLLIFDQRDVVLSGIAVEHAFVITGTIDCHKQLVIGQRGTGLSCLDALLVSREKMVQDICVHLHVGCRKVSLALFLFAVEEGINGTQLVVFDILASAVQHLACQRQRVDLVFSKKSIQSS